jgi:spore coat protein CotF
MAKQLDDKLILTDLLNTLKEIMVFQDTAQKEGSSVQVRKLVDSAYHGTSKTQFDVYNLMVKLKFYPMVPADKQIVKETIDMYSEI